MGRHMKVINFTKNELDSFIEAENSCVTINNSTYSIALYPYHLSNVSASIKRLLNAKVGKYDQRLDGLLLGYKNLKLITPYAALKADSCYIHVDIQGEFYIFKPKVGAKLTAIVNKTSSNHIGCLVHKAFNVSVPNKSENKDWPGFSVKIGNILELSVTKIALDERLPYIRASIVSNITKPKNNSIITETENEQTVTPKKQNKKKKDLNQTNDVVDSGIELMLESTKKQKKRRSKQTENNVEAKEETPNLESPKKQKKKRNSEPEKNEVSSMIIDDLDKIIKVEKFSQNTVILNESLKKLKKKRQSQDEPNNLETPKKQNTKILSDSQRTNESDYFATPKIKKKQKQTTDTNKEETDTILQKDSLEDFMPKEKKSKTDSGKKKKNKQNEKLHINLEANKKNKQNDEIEAKLEANKKNKQNDEIEAKLEANKSDSAKKKKNKQNDGIEAKLEERKPDSAKKKKNKQNNSFDDLQSALLAEHLQKQQKKRKSKELKSEQKPLNISPVKPMADLEDRKIKKSRQSHTQNIDWENKELNLYDSDLEKTLNTPFDNNYLIENSLEFNLAKIQALNANTPRKRKHKHDTEEDFIHSVHKKKRKIEED